MSHEEYPRRSKKRNESTPPKENNQPLERSMLACSYGLAKGTGLKIQYWYDAVMAKRRRKTLSDQIRAAIRDSGESRYKIAQMTEINESQLSGFFRGTRGLSLEAADRLAKYLGLEIRKRKDRK